MLTMHFKVFYLQLTTVSQFRGALQTLLEKAPEFVNIRAYGRVGDVCSTLTHDPLFGSSTHLCL